MEFNVIDGSEAAHIYRDKLRGRELELTRLHASQLAGEDVPDGAIEKVQEQIDALKKAAAEAEGGK